MLPVLHETDLSSMFQLRATLGKFKTEALTPNTPARIAARPLNVLGNTRARSCAHHLGPSGGARGGGFAGDGCPAPQLSRLLSVPQPSPGQGCSVPYPPPNAGHGAPGRAVPCLIAVLFTRLDVTSDTDFLFGV